MKTPSNQKDQIETELEMRIDDPFDDIDCQTAFIESNYEDFEMWCQDHGWYKDYYCDHEFDYCQAREDAFLEFAANYQDDSKNDKADKDNEVLKEKNWD